MMFRCVQGKIGASSEDNGGGGALGPPGVHCGAKSCTVWRSKVVQWRSEVAPEPRLEGCAQPTVQGQSMAARLLPFKIQIQGEIQMDIQTQK